MATTRRMVVLGGLGAAGVGLTSAERFVSEVYQELKSGAK